MKAFYEKWREEQSELALEKNRNRTFPLHFHESVEIFILIKGEYDITINGTKYAVSDNTMVFIDSYDVHSYENRTNEAGKSYMLIIPPKFLDEYRKIKESRKIVNPVVKSEKLCNELIDICDKYPERGITVTQAALNLVFALVAERLDFRKEREKDESLLIRKILIYAQENFREDASVSDFAKKTGYSKEHVSRTFHRYMQTGFPDYINSLRLDYVKKEMTSGEKKKITDVIYDAGFKSIQSYYRTKNSSKL